MKRILFTLLLIFVFPMTVFAFPFLCSDLQTNVEIYEVSIDNVIEESIPQDMGDGTVRLHYDLLNISNGTHEVTVRAGNVWGWSEWSPFFSFEKAPPLGVPGICISKD